MLHLPSLDEKVLWILSGDWCLLSYVRAGKRSTLCLLFSLFSWSLLWIPLGNVFGGSHRRDLHFEEEDAQDAGGCVDGCRKGRHRAGEE